MILAYTPPRAPILSFPAGTQKNGLLKISTKISRASRALSTSPGPLEIDKPSGIPRAPNMIVHLRESKKPLNSEASICDQSEGSVGAASFAQALICLLSRSRRKPTLGVLKPCGFCFLLLFRQVPKPKSTNISIHKNFWSWLLKQQLIDSSVSRPRSSLNLIFPAMILHLIGSKSFTWKQLICLIESGLGRPD